MRLTHITPHILGGLTPPGGVVVNGQETGSFQTGAPLRTRAGFYHGGCGGAICTSGCKAKYHLVHSWGGRHRGGCQGCPRALARCGLWFFSTVAVSSTALTLVRDFSCITVCPAHGLPFMFVSWTAYQMDVKHQTTSAFSWTPSAADLAARHVF